MYPLLHLRLHSTDGSSTPSRGTTSQPPAAALSTSQSTPHAPPHEDATMASEPTLSSLAQLAASASANDVLSAPSESTSPATKTKEQLRRHYIRTLHKVVDESDVVVLVLDARDPAGCRSRLVEEEVRRREAEGKRLVFVLNKIGTLHISSCHALRLPAHRHCMGRGVCASRSGTTRECPSMAQTPPPHNTNAPIPLGGPASAHEPRL
jgi:hypothetical protein